MTFIYIFFITGCILPTLILETIFHKIIDTKLSNIKLVRIFKI